MQNIVVGAGFSGAAIAYLLAEELNQKVLDNFKEAYKFRAKNIDFITNSEITPIKTGDDKIFAFTPLPNPSAKTIVV